MNGSWEFSWEVQQGLCTLKKALRTYWAIFSSAWDGADLVGRELCNSPTVAFGLDSGIFCPLPSPYLRSLVCVLGVSETWTVQRISVKIEWIISYLGYRLYAAAWFLYACFSQQCRRWDDSGVACIHLEVLFVPMGDAEQNWSLDVLWGLSWLGRLKDLEEVGWETGSGWASGHPGALPAPEEKPSFGWCDVDCGHCLSTGVPRAWVSFSCSALPALWDHWWPFPLSC